MIRITFEYATVEHAIVALGKLVGPGQAVAHVHKTDVAGQAAPEPTATSTKQRKGRADKGQPRGPYKEPAAPATTQPVPPAVDGITGQEGKEVPVPAPTAAVPASPVPDAPKEPLAVTTASVGPAGEVPSATACTEIVEKLYNAKGLDAARDILARHGVRRVRDLREDQRAQFVKDADFVLNGGKI